MTIGGNARPAQPVDEVVHPRGPSGGGGGWGVWERGPDTTEANGIDFGGDLEDSGYSVTDSAGRIYFIQDGGASAFARLDPPYTRWFTMSFIETGFGDKGEVHVDGNNKLVLVGGTSVGLGGARYDPLVDAGYLTFSPPPYNPPWEKNWSVDAPGYLLNPQEAWIYASSARAPDGTIYLIGGGALFGAGINIFGSLATGALTATPLPDMPGGVREGHQAVYTAAGIYVFGGNVAGDDQTEERTLYRYNFTSAAWETLAELPDPISSTSGLIKPAMCADGLGRVFLFGGIDDSIPIGSAFRYDPATDAWAQLADVPSGYRPSSDIFIDGECAEPIRIGNRIYLLVYSADGSETAVAAYNTSHGDWQLSPPSTIGHQRGGFAKGGNHLFVIDGYDPSVATSVVEKIRVL